MLAFAFQSLVITCVRFWRLRTNDWLLTLPAAAVSASTPRLRLATLAPQLRRMHILGTPGGLPEGASTLIAMDVSGMIETADVSNVLLLNANFRESMQVRARARARGPAPPSRSSARCATRQFSAVRLALPP